MLQKAPRKNARARPKVRLDSHFFHWHATCLSRLSVLGISESLVTFVEGAGGALSLIEFRLPLECRILDSLVGTLAAIGVQILHIQVHAHQDHVAHRLRVAECDGSNVAAPRRLEVQGALLGLVEAALRNVRRPLAKSQRHKKSVAV
jgi:hypothetical protein